MSKKVVLPKTKRQSEEIEDAKPAKKLIKPVAQKTSVDEKPAKTAKSKTSKIGFTLESRNNFIKITNVQFENMQIDEENNITFEDVSVSIKAGETTLTGCTLSILNADIGIGDAKFNPDEESEVKKRKRLVQQNWYGFNFDQFSRNGQITKAQRIRIEDENGDLVCSTESGEYKVSKKYA